MCWHPGMWKTLELVKSSVAIYGQGCVKLCVLMHFLSETRIYSMRRSVVLDYTQWIRCKFASYLMSKHNMVLVIVDQLTKMAYFIPNTTKETDVQVADLFIQHIFCIHGIPETIVSN